MSYNGWSNYPTWALFNYLENYSRANEWVNKQCEELTESEEDADVQIDILKRRISGWVDNNKPWWPEDLFRNILYHAIGMIDFQEIAEHYINLSHSER